MNQPLSPAAIARAMREAVRIAAHGTPDQRAGRFSPSPPKTVRKVG